MRASREDSVPNILKRELQDRIARIPNYSLRKFAKDLGLHPSRLSEIINRRHGVSRKTAFTIAHGIGWGMEECNYFLDLADSQFARNKSLRELALERVNSFQQRYHELPSAELLKSMAWYHFAILEMFRLKPYAGDTLWIVERLGISFNEASNAIELLKRAKLLSQNAEGNWSPSWQFYRVDSKENDSVAKTLFKQLLALASSKLDSTPAELRGYSSLITTIDPAHIEAAKNEIKNFRKEFDQKYGASTTSDRVYCLAVQLFPLDQDLSGSNKTTH